MKMSEFTDNKPFMNNILKLHSDLVQVLVQKYLEDENKNIPVYMYPELINDIDVFNKRIETIKEIHDKLQTKKPLREYPKTIQAFLDIIKNREGFSYTNTYEVKYESNEYIFKLKNIRQLIDNGIEYPDNTQVELILVPSDVLHLSSDDILYTQLSTFESLRKRYIELDEDAQYQIINTLIHDNGSLNKDTNKVLNRLISHPPHTSFDNNISIERFKHIHNNYLKLKIRIISMETLKSVKIDTEYIMNILFPFGE